MQFLLPALLPALPGTIPHLHKNTASSTPTASHGDNGMTDLGPDGLGPRWFARYRCQACGELIIEEIARRPKPNQDQAFDNRARARVHVRRAAATNSAREAFRVHECLDRDQIGLAVLIGVFRELTDVEALAKVGLLSYDNGAQEDE
jgi:hypothetical protein